MASSLWPGAASAAARRNESRIFSQARSSQARNSSFFVRKRRNRYGCGMPASRAIASGDVPWGPPPAAGSIAPARISSRRSSADLRRVGAATGRYVSDYLLASQLALFAPDLDRDLFHRQRNRRLGLGGLDRHALGAELGGEPVRDHRAQPLERLVRALLGDQGDDLADLAVVDRVLDAVGDQRVRL